MSDYYYLFIIFTFLLSGLILFLSISKFRILGLLDSAVILSWFYIFIRPLGIDLCGDYISKDLYFWHAGYYEFGVFYSVLSLLLFQIGALIYSSRVKTIEILFTLKVRQEFFLSSLNTMLKFFILLYFFLLLVIFASYGAAILPWNRPSGSFSTSLPGFQFYWPLIRLVLFFSIPASLILYFEKQKFSYLIIFSFIIMTALLFGRRGMIVGPVLFFLFVYSFYIFKYKGLSIRTLFKLDYFLIVFVLFFIIFYGKDIVSVLFDEEYASHKVEAAEEIKLLCKVLRKGHQEYDIYWPAVIEGYSSLNFFDILPAMTGGFIPHELRLLEYKSFYSITDKLMMEFVGDVYLHKKFGISPNIHQFYYSYFGYFSLILIFLIGYMSRNLEYAMLDSIFKSNFFQMYFWFTVFGLITGPFDYTFKYYAVGFVYFSLLYIVYKGLFIKHIKN